MGGASRGASEVHELARLPKNHRRLPTSYRHLRIYLVLRRDDLRRLHSRKKMHQALDQKGIQNRRGQERGKERQINRNLLYLVPEFQLLYQQIKGHAIEI